ncbi:MAG: mechanosensitive ion channel family protein [Desulfobacteraceae bacterium]|nr:mechanosensitive ion channel family protein [Desulfobacteraceae bacterium]
MEKWTAYIDNMASMLSKNTILVIWIKAGIAIAFGMIGWIMLKIIIYIARKKLAKSKFKNRSDQIILALHKTLGLSLIFLVGKYLIDLFSLKFIDKIFPAVFIILFCRPLVDFMLVLLNYLQKNWAQKTVTKIDDIIFELLKKFSGAAMYCIAAILALDMLGINVVPFIAGAGIMGIAIGFAAKDTLSNLIAGILLIIDRPFEIGDRIEVWEAPKNCSTWGDVLSIGLRATRIKTTDNIIIVIPNNEIMKRDIVNYTIISDDIRVRVNIGVSYDTDIEKAKVVIEKVASQIDWVLKDPAPKVIVNNFGESSVDLRLFVWIADARKRIQTVSHITDHVKSAFDAEGIEIPYPKRDITIVNAKPAQKQAE